MTEFDVDRGFLDGYEIQTVGSRDHREYWIPAEDLPRFNGHIVGTIRAVERYPAD